MTKKDLGEIRQVVKKEINGRVTPLEKDVKDLKGDVKDLKGEFSYLNQKIDQNHREVMTKFDQFLTMESEDIIAVQGDVEELKTRVTKLEASRA